MRNDESDPTTGYDGPDAKEALQSLMSFNVEPSPFLKTRILAHAREQKSLQIPFYKKMFWPAAVALSLLLAFKFMLLPKGTIQSIEVASYSVGQPYVIRMDIRPYQEAHIAYAEIVIDDEKIQFSSSQFESIGQQRKLVVAWENLVGKQFLPIVIKGLKNGNSEVIVNFYSSDNKLVNSQNVNLKFKGG